MKRTLHGMLALAAVCLLSTPSAFAQVDRAAVSGTVKDSSDAVCTGRYGHDAQRRDQRVVHVGH